MTVTLATGGHVFTPASRDATALAHDGQVVTWVGADRPGPTLFPEARRVDLGGQWVAPAFCETRAPGLSPADAARCGVVVAPRVVPVDPGSIDGEVEAGRHVVLDARGDLSAAAARLGALADRLGGPVVARSAPTIVGLPALDDDTLALFARLGTAVLLTPLLDDDLAGADLVRLASAGFVLALSSLSAHAEPGAGGAPESLRPWAALRAVVDVPHGRGLSPRAAFTAATRGAWRAAGRRDGGSGVLVPGSPAVFARWRTGGLVVAAADDAVRRWSTDPRSGVPPMPDLAGPDPECVELVSDGLAAALGHG